MGGRPRQLVRIIREQQPIIVVVVVTRGPNDATLKHNTTHFPFSRGGTASGAVVSLHVTEHRTEHPILEDARVPVQRKFHLCCRSAVFTECLSKLSNNKETNAPHIQHTHPHIDCRC